MVFSSLLFLFRFLPLALAAYYLAPKKLRNLILFLSSLIFYAWGEPVYVVLILFSTLLDYMTGRIAGSCRATGQMNKARLAVFVSAFTNLALLGFFKYADFFVQTLHSVCAVDLPAPGVALPIGISFYTFQTMSYTIDVYRGDAKVQKNLITFGAYVSLFPQLIAGPIVRFKSVCEQLDHRKESVDSFFYGIVRFTAGLGKKVLIANQIGAVWSEIAAIHTDHLTVLTAWIGIAAYALQIYFDFSGYSDMAIGLGSMFGFSFPENFDYPYESKTVTEFWRRWHISLATWFKLYLYIPLGGNRKGEVRTYLNLFTIFLETGIWHGAAWSYVFWGIWNGIFIVFERFIGLDKDKSNRWYALLGKHIYAFFAIIFGMIIFRSENLHYAYEYICRMLHIDVTKHLPNYDYGINNKFALMLVVGLICAMPLFRNMIYIKYERKVVRTLVNIWLFILFFWSTISLAASTYNPFIYFRF